MATSTMVMAAMGLALLRTKECAQLSVPPATAQFAPQAPTPTATTLPAWLVFISASHAPTNLPVHPVARLLTAITTTLLHYARPWTAITMMVATF